MAILRGASVVAGQAQRIANPAVERSLKRWEERIEEAEQAAFAKARQDAEAELLARVQAAEQRAADAEASSAQAVEDRVAALETEWQNRWKHMMAHFAGVVNSVDELRRNTLASAEGEVVRLACALAGRLLHERIDTGPEWLSTVARAALAESSERRGLTVILNEQDATDAAPHIAEAAAALGGSVSMPAIEGDPARQPGSCTVEGGGTTIDVSIPEAWARIVDMLAAEAPEAGVIHESAPADAVPLMEQPPIDLESTDDDPSSGAAS
jgi:flagellar assembly protein FliH